MPYIVAALLLGNLGSSKITWAPPWHWTLLECIEDSQLLKYPRHESTVIDG